MSGSTTYKPLKFLIVRLLLILLMPLCTHQSIASDAVTLEIYETYYQSQKVAEVISSLLKPNESIKSYGNKLIVRASDDTHEKILYVLEEIDRAPQNFLISIRATDQYQSKKNYTTSEIKVIDDNTVVHVNNANARDDGVVFYKGSSRDGKISMAVTAKDNLTTRKEDLIQQVRTLEGEPAYITTGSDIPVVNLIWANGQMLPITEIDRAVTGFYVTPIFSKGHVILDISFQKQDRKTPTQRQKDRTAVSTKLRIPVNEWAPLAGVSDQNHSISSGTLYSTNSSGSRQQGIEIKVETIK
ncbi:MAG: hypothetical protein MI976_25290 [Pseudomonadales bacterium]|nr:hypothetical protein [Pseudomonadales bacterium]